jgi:hypothetical protein
VKASITARLICLNIAVSKLLCRGSSLGIGCPMGEPDTIYLIARW